MEQEPLSIKQKIWNFGDSPWTWGGLGLVGGGVGVLLSLKALLAIATIPIIIAIVRGKFFDGRSLRAKIAGNVGLSLVLIILMIGLWKIVPKPKECPTLAEITNAMKETLQTAPVVNKVPEVGQEIAQLPTAKPPEVRHPFNAKPKKVAPKKPVEEIKPSVPATETEQETGNKVSPPITNDLPQTAPGIFSISQKKLTSTRADAQFEAQVVIQTTIEFPSLKLAMECDKPLVDAQPQGPGSAMMAVRWGVVKDRPTIFVFSYGSSVPPFGPANPLVVTVWSKEETQCNNVATF